jgi:hypothetical protein
VDHYVLWTIMSCGPLCLVDHCVLWTIMSCGPLCLVDHYVLWTIMSCGPLCLVDHCVCTRFLLVPVLGHQVWTKDNNFWPDIRHSFSLNMSIWKKWCTFITPWLFAVWSKFFVFASHDQYSFWCSSVWGLPGKLSCFKPRWPRWYRERFLPSYLKTLLIRS